MTLIQLRPAPNFTLGTVIGGVGTVGTKPVLVRAAGPSLSQLSVANPLADPKLDIFSGQTVIASNDNWSGTTALTTAFGQVGAFAYLSAASRDAAVLSPAMQSGAYTIQVAGAAGSAGMVIAEIYDATPNASLLASGSRLINVSVLKQIAAVTTLTAGFVISGATAKTVLVRAIGPRLAFAPFGIAGAMADPRLTLFSGQTAISTNDNWGGDPQLTAAGNSVGAFAVSDVASRDPEG